MALEDEYYFKDLRTKEIRELRHTREHFKQEIKCTKLNCNIKNSRLKDLKKIIHWVNLVGGNQSSLFQTTTHLYRSSRKRKLVKSGVEQLFQLLREPTKEIYGKKCLLHKLYIVNCHFKHIKQTTPSPKQWQISCKVRSITLVYMIDVRLEKWE